MRIVKTLSRGTAVAMAAAVTLISLTVADAGQSDGLSAIRIKNFGRVNDRYYRGAEPGERGISDLASLGVKAVIDLQKNGEPSEQQWVESAGMKFYRIGMSDGAAPSSAQVAEFLKIVDDPANQPVFIHCHGGRHRAGVMTAIYRLTHDGWTPEQAYAEMKQYEFDKGFGHGDLKAYVYDYYGRMDKKGVVVVNSK